MLVAPDLTVNLEKKNPKRTFSFFVVFFARHPICATFHLRDIPIAPLSICATFQKLRDIPSARLSNSATSSVRDIPFARLFFHTLKAYMN